MGTVVLDRPHPYCEVLVGFYPWDRIPGFCPNIASAYAKTTLSQRGAWKIDHICRHHMDHSIGLERRIDGRLVDWILRQKPGGGTGQ